MHTPRIQACAVLLLGLLFNIPALYAGPSSTPNAVLEVGGPGLARLDVRLNSKDLEPVRLTLKGDGGSLVGSVQLSTEYPTDYEITAFNQDGKVTHAGKGTIQPFAEGDRPLSLPLPSISDGAGLVASLTHERIVLTVKPGESGTYDGHFDILDPLGNPTKIDPLDIRYGLSDVRDMKLVPIPDTQDFHVVPRKDLPPQRLCVSPPDTYICLPNGHCRPIPICSDPWVTISGGSNHTCALTQSGLAYCWGLNNEGQLGASSTNACNHIVTTSSDCSTKPLAVTCPAGSPCRFTQISSGETLTAAIDTNGDAWWWGRGGVAHHKVTATLAGSSVKFQLIAAGYGHACAISQGRSEIWCWGANAYGESGLPARTPYEVPDWSPNRVLAPFAFKKIVAGSEHTCAVGSGGTDVVCWGRDDVYTRQTSGPSSIRYPAGTGQFFFQQFGSLVSIQDLAASRESSCVTLAGGVKCWGRHLGTNVSAFATPDHLTAGDGQVCTLLGQVASCTGTNNWGEFGIGSNMTPAVTPVLVKAPPPLYTVLSAGAAHTCGITPDGNAYCWGSNQAGQLGNGSASYSVNQPALVVKP
jgi:alpha-tubulin suppressor-like RCC1 family protein